MSNTKNALSVLSFGEILWDNIDGQKYLGGAPLNFAAHIVKCGGRSAVISALGNDELGQKALRQLTALQIDPSFIQVRADRPTGTVDVFLLNGQPDYNIQENVVFDFISTVDPDKVLTNNFNTFYFGTLVQRNERSRTTLCEILDHHKFDHIFYDINLRKNYYSADIIQYSLQQCTIFKINNDEVQTISTLFYKHTLPLAEFAQRVATDFQIQIVIITAGEHGCYTWSAENFDYIPPITITVADAVGAGDAFSAAFMQHYYKSGNVRDAAILGNKIGAYVASANGAIPDYSDEIKKIL